MKRAIAISVLLMVSVIANATSVSLSWDTNYFLLLNGAISLRSTNSGVPLLAGSNVVVYAQNGTNIINAEVGAADLATKYSASNPSNFIAMGTSTQSNLFEVVDSEGLVGLSIDALRQIRGNGVGLTNIALTGVYQLRASLSDISNRLEALELYVMGQLGTLPPTISGVTVTLLNSTNVGVSWTVNEAATNHVVEYGETTEYGSTVMDNTISTSPSNHITGLTPSTTYHYRVYSTSVANDLSRTNADSTFTTPATPTGILTGMIAYYKLNDDPTWADSYDALSLSEAGEVTNSLAGDAASFARGHYTNYLYHADSESYSAGDNSLTITAWFSPIVTNLTQGAVAKMSGTAGGMEYGLGFLNTSGFYFNFYTNAATPTVLSWPTNNVLVNTWYFLVGEVDTTNKVHKLRYGATNATHVFLSGWTNSGTWDGYALTNGSAEFWIGKAGAVSSYVRGRVKKVGVWNRLLTDDEIAELWNNGSGTNIFQ